MKLKKLFAACCAGAVLAGALTGCGGGSGGGSFTWFVDTIPTNLDPQVASAASDVIACENLYSGLVRKGADGQLKPALAESWTLSADRRTYTFALKSGLTYTAAKGGIAVAIAQELQVPVKYAGVGEGVDDLKPFDPMAFAEALI